MPPQHPSKRRASEGSVPQEEDAQYWKNMAVSLQQQRATEAEAQLTAFAQESEKREESLKAYIHHLETQIKEASSEEKKGMQATIDKQAKEIALYQVLTGTSLCNVDPSKHVACDCTVTNSEDKKTTKFRLDSSETGEQTEMMIKYEPIGKPDASLPEFLYHAIEFEASQAPALMQNVLKGMFPDEE